MANEIYGGPGGVDPATLLGPVLRPGERLLWAGRPERPSIGDVYSSPARLLGFLAVLAVVFVGLSAASGDGTGIRLGVIVLVLFVGVILGTGAAARRRSRGVVYGITAERAIARNANGDGWEAPLAASPALISHDRHGWVTVDFDPLATSPGHRQVGPSRLSFRWVVDADGLLGALGQARPAPPGATSPPPPGWPAP